MISAGCARTAIAHYSARSLPSVRINHSGERGDGVFSVSGSAQLGSRLVDFPEAVHADDDRVHGHRVVGGSGRRLPVQHDTTRLAVDLDLRAAFVHLTVGSVISGTCVRVGFTSRVYVCLRHVLSFVYATCYSLFTSRVIVCLRHVLSCVYVTCYRVFTSRAIVCLHHVLSCVYITCYRVFTSRDIVCYHVMFCMEKLYPK